MRCARCHRPLLKPCKSIETKDGDLHFGAACALKAGLRKARVRIISGGTAPARDPRTRDWVDELRQGLLP